MVPITISAVGPAMLRLAGRMCDGVRLHPFCTRVYLENVVTKEIGAGLERGARPREHFEVNGGGFIVTGADEATVARRAEHVRQRVAFYGSTRSYFPVWAEHGLEDLGEKLRRMSIDGAWDRMAAEISDDVLRLFAVIGTHDTIVERIAQRFGGVSDAVAEAPDPESTDLLPPDLIQDIQRLASPFRGFAAD